MYTLVWFYVVDFSYCINDSDFPWVSGDYKYEWSLISHPEGDQVGQMDDINTASLKLSKVSTVTYLCPLSYPALSKYHITSDMTKFLLFQKVPFFSNKIWKSVRNVVVFVSCINIIWYESSNHNYFRTSLGKM